MPGLAILAGLCGGAAVLACVALLVALLTGSAASAAVPSDGTRARSDRAGAAPSVDPPAPARVPDTRAGDVTIRSGRWQWPLRPDPDVVRRFDPPADRWGAGHRGVDLLAADDAPVYAAGGGVVGYAGWLAGRGVVMVTHGSLRTTYEPVRAAVHVGDKVAAGSRLGTLQSVGSHCAPLSCLHWGLLRGDVYLDPLALLRTGPSRLLPVWGVPEPAGGDRALHPIVGGSPVAVPREGTASTAASPADPVPSAPSGADRRPVAAATLAAAATSGALVVRNRGRP